jgi:hypothetical protein
MNTPTRVLLAAAVCCLAFVPAAAENVDPGNDNHQFAWGENVGWINAEPSGNGGPGMDVGNFALTGWMWGENAGWLSLSCSNTASCGTAQYGVTNDGYGKLSGFAWAENVGWVNFAPTTCQPDPTCGVGVDPATGYFFGRAWGENVGWVTFASAAPIDSTVRTSWCGSVLAPPGMAFSLTAKKVAGELQLNWSALAGSEWYDVVAGNLNALRSSGGNFTTATTGCSAGKLGATSHDVVGPPPPAGSGIWFLVRGANCRGPGSYDTGSPKQIGLRDAEIAASGLACP